MDRQYVLRSAREVAWLFVLSLAGAFVMFAGSQDASLIGGRFPAAAVWVALWLGTLGLRRPPTVPLPVVAGVAAVGVPVTLLAPSPSAPAFAAIVAIVWICLSATYLAWTRVRRPETSLR